MVLPAGFALMNWENTRVNFLKSKQSKLAFFPFSTYKLPIQHEICQQKRNSAVYILCWGGYFVDRTVHG
jgi:hypothetical protein